MNTAKQDFYPKNYQRPYFFFNRHLETIIPSIFRRVELPPPESGILELADGDFVEYDHYQHHNPKLVVLCHGLEGNSRKGYMMGMAKALLAAGHDVLAWNYRCCGKLLNRTERLYHSGATGDLEAVINHFAPHYSQTRLVGFSLGGNLILKYLGELPERSAIISGAVTFSVPADLKNASFKLARTSNLIYSRYFLSGMKKKIKRKADTMPDLKRFRVDGIRSILEFDECITAPLNGYSSAMEYYRVNSCLNFLNRISTPTLVINAKNDPFLTPGCSPAATYASHPFVRFLTPDQGGHVGFYKSGGRYWSEDITVGFFNATGAQ